MNNWTNFEQKILFNNTKFVKKIEKNKQKNWQEKANKIEKRKIKIILKMRRLQRNKGYRKRKITKRTK